MRIGTPTHNETRWRFRPKVRSPYTATCRRNVGGSLFGRRGVRTPCAAGLDALRPLQRALQSRVQPIVVFLCTPRGRRGVLARVRSPGCAARARCLGTHHLPLCMACMRAACHQESQAHSFSRKRERVTPAVERLNAGCARVAAPSTMTGAAALALVVAMLPSAQAVWKCSSKHAPRSLCRAPAAAPHHA